MNFNYVLFFQKLYILLCFTKYCIIQKWKMDTQLKKGVLDLCVLKILEKKDCYGYELVQSISKNVQISEGTLYPILRRLEKEGYLEKYFQESKEGPSRKYYGLTRKGKQKSKELNQEWKEFTKKVNEILK